MGGAPFMAINLLGFPPAGLPNAVLTEILAGGAEVCAEAGCAVAGGHSVRDEEVKYGLAVTGLVHPGRILRNSTARPGDRLVLTKPLGTGALVAAAKAGKLPDADAAELVRTMTTLNQAGTVLSAHGATACTDVTGFGLSGHALEMARGSDVTLAIATETLPLLPRAVELCAEGFTCGGTKSNASFVAGGVSFASSLSEGMVGLVNDPQTSGGLLVAIPAERVAELCDAALAAGAPCAVEIGEVRLPDEGEPGVVFD
jgi:selenide,water dikinase